MEPETEPDIIPEVVESPYARFTDRELLEYNTAKTEAILSALQGIHDSIEPMMTKVGPFLAGMGL